MRNSQKDFHKKLLGRNSEKAAVKYLKEQGFTILKTNYKTPFGEADIVAEDNKIIVFCEVKARTSDLYGLPSEAIDFKKQQRYIKIAEYYLYVNSLQDTDVRFDAIEVLNGQLSYIKNAFFG